MFILVDVVVATCNFTALKEFCDSPKEKEIKRWRSFTVKIYARMNFPLPNH
jgi:hypothetical protein